jgi:bifunctional non-homologous end joining protein LigD
MSLNEYKKKRNFVNTSEPVPLDKSKGTNKKTSGPELVFVVHKHYASHLHYDLRLELDGVLKSWAIPKGPSLDPGEKRLSVMVEDHPFDYKDFEGLIPEGNYGAGRVYIWDEGTYRALGAESRVESSNAIREGMLKGHITFILKGSRLKGEFALIRLKKSDPKNWLLIKKNDEFASETDIAQYSPDSIHTAREKDDIKNNIKNNLKTGKKKL